MRPDVARPSTAWRPRRAATGRAARDERLSAPTPSRRGCSPRTPTRSGSRRRASPCTGSAPSSTSARLPPTAGSPRTRARFHFVKRYGWEPWHFGFALNAGIASVGYGGARRRSAPALPSFVPARFAPAFARAAQRWSVSAALLAAQLYAGVELQPVRALAGGRAGHRAVHARAPRALRPAHPFDPRAAIDAQAHPCATCCARFASVPLALAAYNAGAGRVRACMCIPPIPETQAYVADILGLLHGAGDPPATPRGRWR